MMVCTRSSVVYVVNVLCERLCNQTQHELIMNVHISHARVRPRCQRVNIYYVTK